ncbi:MAG: integrin alpha [Planctomycetota bacterium]|nr:integrin alpha [Planctomycetota bacterium]
MRLPQLELLAGVLILTPFTQAQLPIQRVVDSPDDSTAFGVAATRLGDVDGDLVADFAVADTTAIPFTPPDEVHVFSGATGALLATYVEENAGDNFGQTLVGVGDLDGDLVPDLLVGAPGHDFGGTAAGKAKVLSGATGAELLAFHGTANLHAMGSTLAAPGDLDGDGKSELLIAAAGENKAPSWGGIVRLYRGSDGAELFEFGNGASTHDIAEGYGQSLAGAGDLDGDGVIDLLIGVPARHDSIHGRTGAVEARSGADGSLLFVLSDTVHPVSNQAFGRSIAGGTDLNGDGVPEILVGTSGDKETGQVLGAVFVIDGATQNVLAKHLGHAAGPGSLGHHVAFVGDVNGDGFEDYAGGYDYGGTIGYSGFVQVWSGADHALLDELATGAAGFGSCLVALGDVTGDGLPDLLVGAKQDREVQLLSVAGARG